MSSTAQPSTAVPHSRWRRMLRDAPIAIGISALIAVVIVLIIGRPETLFEQLVFSIIIGTIAFVIVNGARLLLWDRSNWGLREWTPFALLVIVTAPVAHFGGMQISGALLGIEVPTLAQYPSLNQLSMIVLTLIVVAGMVVLVRHREHMRRANEERAAERLRAEVIERQALQAQLRLMQAQIEPHMLFNTLANLQGLIAIDPDRASEMLDQLIQYLRATLSVSRSETTTLEQEFSAMEAYLGLMKVRMGDRLRYRLELPPELRKARLPTMLLQPLVENAIVHGLEPKIDGGAIVIQASADGASIEVEVRDTGLGLGQVHGPRGGGVGVSTTRERLEALYGARAAITLLPVEPHGTLARLTLPLESPA